MKNLIGIDKNKAKKLIELLNQLLANYQLYYQNVRGFHWNIKGKAFFELHIKFEELYTNAGIKIDEIAERILTLEGEPLHTFSDYLKQATIKENQGVKDGTKSVEYVVLNLSILVSKEREILNLAGAAEDEGTLNLMGDYISETEKTLWMLNAYLN